MSPAGPAPLLRGPYPLPPLSFPRSAHPARVPPGSPAPSAARSRSPLRPPIARGPPRVASPPRAPAAALGRSPRPSVALGRRFRSARARPPPAPAVPHAARRAATISHTALRSKPRQSSPPPSPFSLLVPGRSVARASAESRWGRRAREPARRPAYTSPRGSGYPPAPGCTAARVGPRPLACGLACGRARPRRGARLSWSFRCPRPCARGGVAKSSPCPRTGELPLHGGPSSAISFSLCRLVPAC